MSCTVIFLLSSLLFLEGAFCQGEIEKGNFLSDGIFVKYAKPAKSLYAEALIMVPGSCHGAWAYDNWLAYFAKQGWNCYAYSHRGLKGSTRVAGEEYNKLKIIDYVIDMEKVVKKINAPVIVIGHSQGRIVIQKYADRNPIEGSIFLCAVGPAALGPMADAEMPSDNSFYPSRESVRTRWFHNIDENKFAEIYGLLEPESAGVMNEFLRAKCWTDKKYMSGPMLVVTAEFDKTAVFKDRRIADYYSADYIYARGFGHGVLA